MCSVVTIEKLDTNDSLVDACVRLWVIADFLVLKELQSEAVNILENYCDEKLKAMCAVDRDENRMKIPPPDYKVVLAQLFRGVETAYTQYPHSTPCQQVLISFFYALRARIFGSASFALAVSKAPLQFSHELFLATITGRVSKWTLEKSSEFSHRKRQGNCTYCNDPTVMHRESYVMDPSTSGVSSNDNALSVSWRCTPCFEQHGFERVPAGKKKHW